MCAASLPTDYHDIAVGDQEANSPETEIRKSFAEIGHKVLHSHLSAPGIVHRILQNHVGCGQFIYNTQIAGVAPERVEPPADNRFIQYLAFHKNLVPALISDDHNMQCGSSGRTPVLALAYFRKAEGCANLKKLNQDH